MLTDESLAMLADVQHEDLPRVLEMLKQRAGTEALRDAAKDATSEDLTDPWRQIVPLGEYNLPPFPVDALPAWIADHTCAVAEATQTPCDLAAVLSLAAVATCVQKKAEALVRPGWSEPLNLYAAVVLGPGNRKSAVAAAVTRPIAEHERSERERLRPEVAEKESELRVMQLRLREAEARAGRAKDEREGGNLFALQSEVKELARQIAITPEPGEYRLFVEDCTPEKLAGLLAENGGRMSVISAEGDLFDVMTGRYSNSPNLGVFLKSHNGETLIVDRIGRKGERVERPSLTLGLAIQPDVIRGLMAVKALRGRGMLGRILYSLPQDRLGFRLPDPPPVPGHVAAAWSQGLRALLMLEGSRDEYGHPAPLPLAFSPAANAAMVEYQERVEVMLRPGGEMGDITDWGGKLCGAVARIAGLLHLADAALPARRALEDPVGEGAVRRAIRIGDYLTAHAHAAFAEMGADETVDHARRIVEWIEREAQRAGEITEFRTAELYNDLKRRFKRSEDMMPALSLLADRGYLRHVEPTEEERKHNGKGSWAVNPGLFQLGQRHQEAPPAPQYTPAVSTVSTVSTALGNSKWDQGSITTTDSGISSAPEGGRNGRNVRNDADGTSTAAVPDTEDGEVM